MHQHGIRCGPAFELKQGEQYDIHNPRVLRLLRRWAESGRLWYVHFGTPCTYWSITNRNRKSHEKVGLRAA
eukprot:3641728-Heterocapsa_arctica.AAC.1